MEKGTDISFIGGGNMAAALISGLHRRSQGKQKMHVVDLNPDVLQNLAQRFKVTTTLEIDQSLRWCKVIVLAVKPNQIRGAAILLRPHLTDQLVISIAAGVRISNLVQWLGGYGNVIRCMPNMPALIGQGITGMVATEKSLLSARNTADSIMSSVGDTLWLENEEKINAITAVSGSGPAYVFYFIEAVQQAAQELGLSKEQSARLVGKTFAGATQLATQSSEPISLLREKVTSKNGTTYAALQIIEASDLKKDIIRAVKAASERGYELGKE